MESRIQLANKVLKAFSLSECALRPAHLRLPYSNEDLTLACTILTLFELIKEEEKGENGYTSYTITPDGIFVANSEGGLRQYLSDSGA